MPGCVFEHFGRIPENVYHPETFNSPLEDAVHKNDSEKFQNLAKVSSIDSIC